MIAIIKYNAGNITSVQNALNRMGYSSLITDDRAEIQKAEKIIFPGVGEASSAMKYLKEKGLDQVIKELTQPLLGICLGQQLLCAYSEENNTQCLGIFETKVKRFSPNDKVPHIGWNSFDSIHGPLFKDVSLDSDVYYVHSYFAELNKYTAAVCQYIQPFSAAMQKDNYYATQFHPEKSGAVGTQILQNFLNL